MLHLQMIFWVSCQLGRLLFLFCANGGLFRTFIGLFKTKNARKQCTTVYKCVRLWLLYTALSYVYEPIGAKRVQVYKNRFHYTRMRARARI